MEHEYQITAEGSLGLLALGDLGILAWKKVVSEGISSIESSQTNLNTTTNNDKITHE